MRTREVFTVAAWLSLPLLGLVVAVVVGPQAGLSAEMLVVGLALLFRPHLGRRLADLFAGQKARSDR